MPTLSSTATGLPVAKPTVLSFARMVTVWEALPSVKRSSPFLSVSVTVISSSASGRSSSLTVISKVASVSLAGMVTVPSLSPTSSSGSSIRHPNMRAASGAMVELTVSRTELAVPPSVAVSGLPDAKPTVPLGLTWSSLAMVTVWTLLSGSILQPLGNVPAAAEISNSMVSFSSAMSSGTMTMGIFPVLLPAGITTCDTKS